MPYKDKQHAKHTTLPCPFCGSTIIETIVLPNLSWCECHGCLTEGPLAPTERLAIEGWNNRTNQIKETTK